MEEGELCFCLQPMVIAVLKEGESRSFVLPTPTQVGGDDRRGKERQGDTKQQGWQEVAWRTSPLAGWQAVERAANGGKWPMSCGCVRPEETGS